MYYVYLASKKTKNLKSNGKNCGKIIIERNSRLKMSKSKKKLKDIRF